MGAEQSAENPDALPGIDRRIKLRKNPTAAALLMFFLSAIADPTAPQCSEVTDTYYIVLLT